MKSGLSRLIKGNVRNLAAEQLYLRTNIDISRPTQVYALINRRCNSKCKMCDCWRDPSIWDQELPAAIWNRFIDDLSDFSKGFSLSLSGGEPLLKQDLFEILDRCKARKVATSVTTNGLLLNERNINKLLEAQLLTLNISLDSLADEVNDVLRGVPDETAIVLKNLDKLIELNRASGTNTPIVLKAVVSKYNLNDLHILAEYARDNGLSGVSYQPLFEWSDESREMMDVDFEDLAKAVDRLVQMKEDGYPILNSKSSILQWNDYFAGKAKRTTSACVVPLRNIFIDYIGNIVICGRHGNTIGNIKDDLISEIWFKQETRKMRKRLVHCKQMCLATCTIKRSFKDYLALFSRLRR